MKKQILFILFCATYLITYAQKETKDPFTVQIAITPVKPQPEKPVSFSSVIETPINAPKAQLAQWEKEDLSLSGAKFIIAGQSSSDWVVKLKTSDIKVTSRNEKPINEIDNSEYLIKYVYEATVTVTDKSGNVLFQSDLAESGKEQELAKNILFLNPAYKVKLSLAKNNPTKTKALVDEMMTNVNVLILEGIVDKAGKLLDNTFEDQSKTINLSLFSVKGKGYDEISTVNEKITEVYSKFHALSKKNRLPKEEVDKVMREAIPVWEKYIANNKELEEKATKGLTLNCALASAWLGEYAKSSESLAKVSEAKMPLFTDENSNSGSVGATPILSFDQSAENVFYFNQVLQEGKERATIIQ